jgi:hypothetical protein
MEAVYSSYRGERKELAEATHLTPRGLTLKEFNSPASKVIPKLIRTRIADNIRMESLPVSLLVAGFDASGKGHIFSVSDYEDRGRPRRHDIPGYCAIGSGGDGAMYMMTYREAAHRFLSD